MRCGRPAAALVAAVTAPAAAVVAAVTAPAAAVVAAVTAPAAAVVAAVTAPAAARPAPSDLPRVEVRHDNVAIDRSCLVVIPRDAAIPDGDGNGVIQIAAGGIEVVFDASQGTLRGTADPVPWEEVTGTAVAVEDHANVTIRGAHLHGYKVGIQAERADGLVVEDCDVSGGFAMRLHSTPDAEDPSDWIFPHANDEGEWLQRYGAGIAVRDSRKVTIRGCRARRRQNGLVLDRVRDSFVYDNDFSFLSGWGIALWRSGGNRICRNAVDFCVRGYSHGVYNRGQDSAGILFFEQCSDNVVAENSATHGGDGFFGFGGSASLEGGGRTGNNGNLLLRNDFSDAAAHGIEMTFSFDNRFLGNRIAGNAICGIWGGYSQHTLIAGNRIERNGDRGYGLERGGIDIEHGADNVIRDNVFVANACGVHLWDDDDGELLRKPWCVANHTGSTGNRIRGNRFERDRLGIHLRATAGPTEVGENDWVGVEERLRREGGAEVAEARAPLADLPREEPVLPGERHPVGARAALGGREAIRMGPWFPRDPALPWIGRLPSSPGEHVYEVWGLPLAAVRVTGDDGIAVEKVPRRPGNEGSHPGDEGPRPGDTARETGGEAAPWILRIRRRGEGGPGEKVAAAYRVEVTHARVPLAPIVDRLGVETDPERGG